MGILINLNYTEKMKLLEYGSNIREKGHWGSSTFLTPEEEQLFSSIENSEDKIELSVYLVRILLNWINENTSEGSFLNNEDTSIIDKIYVAINSYYSSILKNYNFEKNEIFVLVKILKNFDYIQENKQSKFIDLNSYHENEELLARIDKLSKRVKELEHINVNLEYELEVKRIKISGLN